MFRYLGLVWNPASQTSTASADRLRQPLLRHSAWTRVIGAAGIEVFSTGTEDGANRAYTLGQHGAVLGRLFRRTSSLDFEPPEDADPIEDAERHAETAGRTLIQDYWGRYVAFLRSSTGAITVVKDPSGTLPCFVMHHEGVHVVFSWLEDVLHLLPSIPRPTIRWNSIAAVIHLSESSGHPTALDGITQVAAGEAVSLAAARPRQSLLWSAADHARSVISEDLPSAAQRLRATTLQCAASWASCYRSMLLRLSGGVDSSILLACLADERVGADVVCLNYHSPGASSDERRYARLAASRFNRRLIERERPARFQLETILRFARMPSPTSYVGRIVSAAADAEVSREQGTSAMFTGGGGDQLFFELHHWWPAADYLRIRGLDRGFLTAALDAARLGRVSLWTALRLAIRDRLRNAPPRPGLADDASLLNPDALTAEQLRDHQHPVMQQVDGLPIGKLMQLRILTAHGGYYDPLAGDRAPELVNPFLSQPLIELSLGLPTYVLAHGGQGRALARQAFAAELPHEISTRRSKGGMQEAVKAMLRDNLDFARSLLLDGELVARGLVLRHRLEDALSGRPSALAGGAGEVHQLIATEAWIQQWSR